MRPPVRLRGPCASSTTGPLRRTSRGARRRSAGPSPLDRAALGAACFGRRRAARTALARAPAAGLPAAVRRSSRRAASARPAETAARCRGRRWADRWSALDTGGTSLVLLAVVKLTLVGAGGFRTPAIYRALVAGARHDSLRRGRAVRPRRGAAGADRRRAGRDRRRAGRPGRLPQLRRSARRAGGRRRRLLRHPRGRASRAGCWTSGSPWTPARSGRRRPAPVASRSPCAPSPPPPPSPSRSPGTRRMPCSSTSPTPPASSPRRCSGVLGDRVVGICDAPPDMCQRVATAVGLPSTSSGSTTSASTTWAGCARCGTASATCCPDLLADDERLARFEEGRLFGGEWLRAVGMLPNEYLYYYYFEREALASMQAGNLRASRAALPAEHLLRRQRRRAGALAGRERRPARRPTWPRPGRRGASRWRR